MDIGDTVIYRGEAYTVVGMTPMSVVPEEVELRPRRGGENLWVERRLLEPASAPERAAFRRRHRRERSDR